MKRGLGGDEFTIIQEGIQPDFTVFLESMMLETAFSPSWLALEVIESGLIKNISAMSEKLQSVKDLGVETAAQRDFSVLNRCDYIQGFLISLAVSAGDMACNCLFKTAVSRFKQTDYNQCSLKKSLMLDRINTGNAPTKNAKPT